MTKTGSSVLDSIGEVTIFFVQHQQDIEQRCVNLEAHHL